MYLIDETYFIKDLAVPNSKPSLDISSNEVAFGVYIDKYARLLLQNALGNVLFDDLDSNIENGSLKSDAEQKWKDLVNGKSYTYNDKTYKWKGLLFTEGAFKGSVLAHYTYYHWHLEQISQMSGMGEVKGDAINAINVNSTRRSVKVWNEYIEMYQGGAIQDGYKFSYVNGTPFHDYFTQEVSDYVSLLTFLSHNQDVYADALMKIEREGYKNTFGL